MSHSVFLTNGSDGACVCFNLYVSHGEHFVLNEWEGVHHYLTHGDICIIISCKGEVCIITSRKVEVCMITSHGGGVHHYLTQGQDMNHYLTQGCGMHHSLPQKEGMYHKRRVCVIILHNWGLQVPGSSRRSGRTCLHHAAWQLACLCQYCVGFGGVSRITASPAD